MTTVQHNGQVIVFFRTRKECETQALRLAAHVKRQMTANEKTAVDAELTSVENWDASLPSEITPLLHDGVGYHHAGLSSRGRAMVESLFRRGMIRALCATTTLAAGMDLPARLVIVSSVHSPSDYRQMLPVNMVHQMLGRAGRPGRDEQGFGVIVAGSRGEADAIVEHYFYHTGDDSTGRTLLEPRYAPVHSALGTSAALTEQLLAFLDHMQGSTLEHMQDEVLADSYYTYSRRGISRTPMRHLELGVLTASAAIELHALSDTVHAARQGSVGTVRIREVGEDVIGGIVAEQMSGQFTCRFSARLSSGNIVEGPMCSCGRGLDEDGILCQHLVALGIEASTQLGSLADYVIPLALSESSPFEALSRLGLIEGTSDGRVAPTRLGRTVNRLYLRIQTAREMLAMLPLVDSNMQMMALLKHLMFVESGQEQDTLVDAVIGHVVNTSASLADIARTLEQSAGDVFALLERFRWLLHSTAAVAEVGGMTHVCELARQLYNIIDSRFVTKEVITDGDQ
ncbi:MAG: hypothetical protein HXY34_05675 [Candidatus Thorarchaeota archaeon]|nr:hypothetical protein [Candidatus Thorarchaeota archaeon]